MGNKSTLNIASNIDDMRRKNNMGEYQKEEQNNESYVPSPAERVETAPVPEPKKKGRPSKGTALDLNIGINVFLDKPLHKKLQYARAETDISIKDLIYMATDYMMSELFDGPIPTQEGERVIREFKKKMFGTEF